jgi:CubicO group peptidase (beta-lactamase class C family)
MIKLLAVLTLILTIIIYFGCSSKSFEQEIDRIFEKYNKDNSPGAAVAVFENSNIIFSKGYGLADIEKKVKIDSNTNFRLASVTKQFTAMCILMLYEQGKLSLDDKLSKFFPGFPDYADNIIIENLLQHTSGIRDYEDYIDDTVTVQLKDKDVLNIVMAQDSTYFEPGSEHRYSNSGYAVLAMIIEKISGKTFAEFLKENIFDPLGMVNTVAFEEGISKVPNRSYGYNDTDSGMVFSDQSMTSAVLGDGGIYTSINDMQKWDAALTQYRLISKELQEKAWTKGTTSDGEVFDYGYGWRLDEYDNRVTRYHTGSTCGFSNVYFRFPGSKISVLVLMNIRDKPAKELGQKVADLFLN